MGQKSLKVVGSPLCPRHLSVEGVYRFYLIFPRGLKTTKELEEKNNIQK